MEYSTANLQTMAYLIAIGRKPDRHAITREPGKPANVFYFWHDPDGSVRRDADAYHAGALVVGKDFVRILRQTRRDLEHIMAGGR